MAGSNGLAGFGQQLPPQLQAVTPRPVPVDAVASANRSATQRDSESERRSRDSERNHDSARINRIVNGREQLARAMPRREPAKTAERLSADMDADQDLKKAQRDAVWKQTERGKFAPGPAEMVGLPEALLRYDSNGDGRLDQKELQRAVAAKDSPTGYARIGDGQGLYLGPTHEDAGFKEPKRLFEEEQYSAAPDVPVTPMESGHFDEPVFKKIFASEGTKASGAYSAALGIADAPERKDIVT